MGYIFGGRVMKEKNKFSLKHLVLSLFCGFLLFIGLYILLWYMFYATGSIPIWISFLALIGFTYWFYKLKNTKKIWGRTFIGLSIEALALPLVMFIFTVGMSVKQSSSLSGVGVLIGGGIATIFVGFLSFFFGAIMLILGIITLKSVKKEGGKK